ncbi:MAG: gliding motility protein GldC [Chitinophagaceae bacterium]
MRQSTIRIDVVLDDDKVPEDIRWTATDTTAQMDQQAKAMMLALWDRTDKSALRIDLWTKDMMVDEMGEFFFQAYMTMAETFGRATKNTGMVEEMKTFANNFQRRFKEWQLAENKAS